MAEYLSESGPSPGKADMIVVTTAACTAGGGAAGTAGSRRTSGPFSPSYSSAATSPSEYTPSEVSRALRSAGVNQNFFVHFYVISDLVKEFQLGNKVVKIMCQILLQFFAFLSSGLTITLRDFNSLERRK